MISCIKPKETRKKTFGECTLLFRKIKENFVFLAVNRTFATRTSKKTTRYEVHF